MKTTDLFTTSSKKLNESLHKTFGKRINFEQFDLEQLQDARNKLRTQVSQIRGESGFNENLENDAFHQAQWMLDAINAEIAERDEHIIEAEADDDLVMRVEDFLAGWMEAANDYEEYEVHGELVDLADNFDKHRDIHQLRDEIKELGPLHEFYKNLLGFLNKEFRRDLAKSEGFNGDVEEGAMKDVDYDLHQLAHNGDEEDLIDALEGKQGTGVADALNDMMEELKDELASKGMNDVMRDQDKMIEMLMDKLFDEYGEDGEEYGPMDSRYDRNDGSDDADALKSAGFGSDEDYESVQYEDRVDEKAVSKAQQRAAGIALAAKRKGKTPPGKGAAAEMAKMSTKELEKYAGTKHKNLPAKKDESTDEGIISTPAKLIGKTIGGVSKAVGAIAGVPGGIARAFGKGKRRSQDVISGDDEDRRRKESVTRGDKMTKLREGDYYYDHDDERSGSTGAIMRSNTPVYDKLVKAVTKENPNIKTASDLIDYYGDEIEDVIAKLYAEGRERKAPKPTRAAMMLEKALKRQTSESIVREGEVQQASAIVTAKTMVDRVGRWIEELSGMENETLLQLGDSIRDEMGQEQAKAFIEQTAPAIQSALETLKGTRDTLSASVRSLASGEQPADMLGGEPGMGGEEEMGMSAPDAMNMPAEEPAGDEFGAAEPAAGGMEAPGREQRESIERQNRLLKVLAG